MAADEVLPRMGPRLSAAYAAYYATIGLEYVYLPFFFARIGLSPADVGILYAGRIATMIVAQPLTTSFADRTGRPYLVLKIAMSLGFCCASGLFLAHSLPVAALFMWLQAAMRSVCIPLLDTATLRERGPAKYGRTRLWGSIGYGLAALGFASAVGSLAYDQAGAFVLPVYVAVNGLTVLTMYFLREERRVKSAIVDTEPLLNRSVVALMISGAFHWAAVETNNVYFSLVVRERGLPPSTPGLGSAIAIVCEVAVFFTFARLTARAPARLWILVGIATSIGRWAVTAFAHTPEVLILLQGIHAASYALWWAAMLVVFNEVSNVKRRGALQGIIAATVMGCGGAMGSLINGRVLAHFGGQTTFLVATLFDVIALAVALGTAHWWWRASVERRAA